MNEWIVEQSEHYRLIEDAIEYLERNFRRQPSLDEIAASVNLSKFHFQRLFKQWAGVTPNQFLRYLTVEYAKGRLRESKSVFDAAQDSGLSSASRLHDLFVTYEAMTPGAYKQMGKDLDIFFAFLPTPFGECVLALVATFLIISQVGDVAPVIGLNSYTSLILVYLGGAIGINIWLMKGYLDTIPRDIDESAKVEGASDW